MCLNLNHDGSLLIHGDHSVVLSSSEHLQGCAVASLQEGHVEAETQVATSWCHQPLTNYEKVAVTAWSSAVVFPCPEGGQYSKYSGLLRFIIWFHFDVNWVITLLQILIVLCHFNKMAHAVDL